MKFQRLAMLLITALLAASCAPAEEPNPTSSPQALPDGASSDPSANPGSIEEYINEYYSLGTNCANAVQDTYALIDQAQENPGAFNDEDWKKEKNEALVLLADTCLHLVWESGIPNGLEETNSLLLETRVYFGNFIEEFWEGVSADDISMIQTARENLVEATDLFSRAGDAIP